MKLFYYSIILLSAYACNSVTTDKEIITKQTTTKDSVAVVLADSTEVSKKQETFDMSLNGPWTEGLSENATFSINDNKIFFVEHLTTEKLFMNGDTAMVYVDDDSLSSLSYKMYKIHSDTLILDNLIQKIKYWPFNG